MDVNPLSGKVKIEWIEAGFKTEWLSSPVGQEE
jgi:hypothetical protein